MVKIITAREQKIIDKKINGFSLTQNESNILSKSVRPKLREINQINASELLIKLEYNQLSKSIENKIKSLIVSNLNNVKSIILYGSAIQSNYTHYNDIDVLLVTKKKFWNNEGEKYEITSRLLNKAKSLDLNLDLQLIDEESFVNSYSNSPSLIYQLKDHKVIYGSVRIPKRAELSKLDLRMKLDWSDMDDEDSKSNELYQSLRNVLLIKLLLKKIVNNELLNKSVKEELGERIIARLKNNTASKLERRIVLEYIRDLVKETDKEILEAKWEKLAL